MNITGDQCTAVAVKNPKYHPYFITMAGTYAFIDRADGRFNRSMGFMKDFAALISMAWDIDTAYDTYCNNPEAESAEVLKELGLDINHETPISRKILDKLLSDDTHGAFKERYINPFYT